MAQSSSSYVDLARTAVRPSRGSLALALRGAGLAVGLFALANLAGELLRGPFDTTSTWVGGAGLPLPLVRALELVSALALVWHGLARIRPAWARVACASAVGTGALLATVDVVRFYAVVALGRIDSPALLPASLVVAALLAALTASILADRDERPRWTLARAFASIAAAGATWAAMPLLLMFTLGPTRYARHADCAIVFGARVWDDGRPSDSLADRIDEGVRLYRQGLVGKLVMSGGIDGRNGFSEPEVMRDRAVRAGVRAEDVLLDEAGIDTASTVKNSAELMRRHGLRSTLAVTHYYHEPRVKMLFERAGVRTYTVPARMSRRLLKEPYFIAREVLAFWHSFLFQ
ncbi:YdcF family protein [Polyangium aurulentum]|uniref:YdcF family protein n=1 Tax=Polyangium aurulentum TaxID=2567896 RepID=UPI00146F6C1B|nr:YdcF family protein [Polyangium aurulentum]UQA55230.1 YdcF family protein [Polyangium aurulentum]